MKKLFSLASLVAMAVFMSACTLKVDNPTVKVENPQINVNTDGGGNNVSDAFCKVSIAGGTTVDAGKNVDVTLELGTGVHKNLLTPPYTVTENSKQFSDSKVTFQDSFPNNTSSQQTVGREYHVTSSNGGSVNCPVSVVVNPVIVNPNQLTCSLVASPESPVVDQPALLIATASNGKAPYVFSTLSLGSSGSIITDLTAVSPTQSAAYIKYASTGTRTASVQLTDANNQSVNCTRAITTRGTPAIQVTANPLSAVALTGSIVLSTTVSGFSGTPTISYATSTSGINIAMAANQLSATITTTNTAATSFSVLVTATYTTVNSTIETASVSVPLQFTAPQALNCSVSHGTAAALVNKNITFSVTASNGDALFITEFNGAAVTPSSNSKTTSFATSGSKTVTLKARNAAGTFCNAGAALNDTVMVYAPLSCTVVVDPVFSFEDSPEYVYAVASIPTDAYVNGYAYTYSASPTGFYGFSSEVYDPSDYLGAFYLFTRAGNYSIAMTVRDLGGNEAVCTPGSHTVIPWWSGYYP